MYRLVAMAAVLAPASAWWRDEDTHTRGAAPYPYPADRKYNTKNAKTPGAIVEGKINIHLVPHTHDDTGWQITVDQYFFQEVYYVVDTVVDELVKDPKRHFIYVETGFFARWWDEQPDNRRNLTRGLVASGQLEFIVSDSRRIRARQWKISRPPLSGSPNSLRAEWGVVYARRGRALLCRDGRPDNAGPPIPQKELWQQRDPQGNLAD